MTDQEILRAYVERHNEGVETGDFGRMLELFAADAELVFVSVSFGPFQGREAIQNAFARHPPADKLSAGEVRPIPSGASTVYEWELHPGTKAGTIQADIVDEKIVRMVIYFHLV
ncbi:MAG TPA: nuclear transport factor 2 family protein [Candidatus Kapabacteria bacterium]|nr:nuclear transport factor 2 family protein [Candidatus Kapabacteria bacterium]